MSKLIKKKIIEFVPTRVVICKHEGKYTFREEWMNLEDQWFEDPNKPIEIKTWDTYEEVYRATKKYIKGAFGSEFSKPIYEMTKKELQKSKED